MTLSEIDKIFPPNYGGNAQISDLRLALTKFTLNGSYEIYEVDTIAERDALTANQGDVCKVIESNEVYVFDNRRWITLVSSYQSSYNYLYKNTDHIAMANDYIYADTAASSFNITLPVTPKTQTEVIIVDNTSNFSVNNLTVLRNGETIMRLTEDILLNVDSKEYKFIYNGSDWRVFQ